MLVCFLWRPEGRALCWQQTAFTNDKAPLPGLRGHGLQLNLEKIEFTQVGQHIETIAELQIKPKSK